FPSSPRRAVSRAGPSARARTPARGRRCRPGASPPPGTLHRWQAPLQSAPPSACAGGPPARRHPRRGSPAGGGGSSATRPSALRRSLRRSNRAWLRLPVAGGGGHRTRNGNPQPDARQRSVHRLPLPAFLGELIPALRRDPVVLAAPAAFGDFPPRLDVAEPL